MYYEIYLDVLFLVNFAMDYIVLSITGRIMCATVSAGPDVSHSVRARLVFYLRKVLAAFLGAVWVCMILILRLRNPLWNAVTYLAVCGLMVFTMSGQKKPGAIAKGMGIMYLTTCALGGFIHVLYYYTAAGFFLNGLGGAGGGAPLWLLFTGSVIGAPAIRLFWESASARLSRAPARSVAVLRNRGKELRLEALCDTGNSLTDALCGEPVNVVEAKRVEELVGAAGECPYRLIPYSSIGNENGLIPVVRFEQLIIIGKNGAFVVDRPLFALYSGKFAAGTDYSVIINPMTMGRARAREGPGETKG